MSHRARLVGLTAVAALLTTGLATAPATAAEGAAPVTVADNVTFRQDGYTDVDLLANDSDPDGDELALCRLGDIPKGLDLMIASYVTGDQDDNGTVFVSASKPGTYTVTYYACDFDYLTPGTLTVVVEKAPKIKVKVTKTAKPGRLKVVNTSGFPIRFMWGSAQERKPDGATLVRDKAVVVKVQRRSIIWFAMNKRTGAVDGGVVRGIKLPKGSEVLPPGAPKGGDGPMSRLATRWQ